MDIVVSGSESFIGKASVRRFLSHGHTVFALRHSVEEAVSLPEKCDVFVHFGWAGKGSAGRMDEEIQKENIEMSLRALRYAERAGCSRFVFAGSQAEIRGASAYGRAKRRFAEEAELALRHDHAAIREFLHLRIFSVYGPGDHENSLISTLIRAAVSGEDMELGPCSQQWNYTYLEDAVKAIVLLCEKNLPAKKESPVFRTLDIAGRDTRELSAFVKEAWQTLGAEGNLHFGVRNNNAEGDADLLPDTALLCREGFSEEVSFREGILKTASQSRSSFVPANHQL